MVPSIQVMGLRSRISSAVDGALIGAGDNESLPELCTVAIMVTTPLKMLTARNETTRNTGIFLKSRLLIHGR